MKRSIGVTNVCGQFDNRANCEPPFAGLGDPLVPLGAALRLQRQGLHRLDADDRLAQCRRLPGLGADDPAVHLPHRLQIGEDDDRDHPGAQQDDPRQWRIEPEQERQQHRQGQQIEKRRQQLAGQELADPVDLRHLVHRLAGRVALEIIERQAQQPAEQMQVELGVEPRPDHRDDGAPGIFQAAGDRERALELYCARAEAGFGDPEEIYVSLYRAAQIKAELGAPAGEVIDAYLRAAAILPSRAEARHGASRHARLNNMFKEGYEIAAPAIDLAAPPVGRFVEPWIYEWALLDEYAVNAYWADRFQESLDACERLLHEGKLFEPQRERVEANARFARWKLGPPVLAPADGVVQTLSVCRHADRAFGVAYVQPAFPGQNLAPLEVVLRPEHLPSELKLQLCTLENGYFCIGSGQDGVLFDAEGNAVPRSLTFRVSSPMPDLSHLQRTATRLDFDIFIAVDAAWKNYYHWLCLATPKMVMALHLQDHDFRITVPEYRGQKGEGWAISYTEKTWEQSLHLAGLSDRLVRLPSGIYTARRIHTIMIDNDQPAYLSCFNDFVSSYQSIRQKLRKDLTSPRRLLIKRRDNPRISETDFGLLEHLTRNRGFLTVTLEDIDFVTQAELFFNAEAVIAAHGAGLSNIVFGNELRILEINRCLGDQYLRPWFYLLARGRGQYYSFLNATSGEVDLERVKIAVDNLCSGLPLDF